MTEATTPSTEGTRTRGYKKRERTRAQLLAAATEVLAEEGEAFALSQVAVRAGVSHGTLYNYFEDREALLEAVIPELVANFAQASAVELDAVDPALRFAVITTRALRYAAESPTDVRVLLRFEGARRIRSHPAAVEYLHADLAAGRDSGRFLAGPDDATLDVIVGAVAMAAGRVVDGDARDGYVAAVVAHLLRFLGLAPDEAHQLARTASHEASPDGAAHPSRPNTLSEDQP